MSVSQTTYIGPYIEADIETKEIQSIIIVNPDTGKIFESGKFDPDSGVGLKEMITIKEVNIKPHAYIDDEDSELSEDGFYSPEWMKRPDGKEIFILNTNCKECGTFWLGDDDDLIELGEGDISPKESIEFFTEKYKDYIEYYRDIMNYTLRIKYGIITYSS